MCPLGYETAQPQNLLFKGAPMKMDDERLNKTHDNHVFIAHKVKEGRVPPSMAGCSGLMQGLLTNQSSKFCKQFTESACCMEQYGAFPT